MHALTLLSFLFFTGLVAFITWRLTRRDDHASTSGYFLAGRSLTFPLIAGSLLMTNLSTEQMVGLNGSAFSDGLSVMAWEVVAVIALVALALFFLPRFLRSGIATLPQMLLIRFDAGTQLICNVIFLIAYAVILLPIILYSGAMGLLGMLDLPGLTGIESSTLLLWLTVWGVGLIGSVYALFGGLRTVAVSDTLNGVGLLVGGFVIVYFGLQAVSDDGGLLAGWEVLKESDPQKLNSIGGSDQQVPFSTLFTGVFLINLFYWTTNQQIIQRTFAAKNLAEGQKGVLLTGFFKLLGPLYLVLPGIIAYHLYADQGVQADEAYGHLVFNVLPPYLTGFFAAVMVGAILSSFNSALNSTTTIFSLGLYKGVLNKQASEEQVVRSGKVFGWIMAFATMTIAPLLAGQESLFDYLQKMNAIYFIPILAVVIVGLLTTRVPPMAAKIALVGGCLLIAAGYFVPPFNKLPLVMHEFHFVAGVFVLLVAMMLLIGKLRPRETAWVHEYSGDVDLTPWRGAVPVGLLLVVLVIVIYAAFAGV
ncbi:solute:sodium symporter family transporter [Halomonas sp. MCCC 1A17488]|uniref:Solute:sodium symporter family transporter n=1 Tax=Billgrantia sulfidoxydans TaxID=2733484 RepID=A0ABX7WAI5_9GAMM|nr:MULTISPECIES: solute:sodium symporter family transporter [Halomonas]MCE8018069.1 solute:sodium symporter family transporter [Halomonas sp. MCCC 1A17488]MCG3241402.1 solute:sodium symporter family transporter [Halomonas sp. MCCC 1A17488]QPP48636.1 solute:sodium symporter family transporter [Halomonas sp. SS10-MC5]QTP55979.1 solute:sodium symporter family transporter [Halomonas sulfidoxydans]